MYNFTLPVAVDDSSSLIGWKAPNRRLTLVAPPPTGSLGEMGGFGGRFELSNLSNRRSTMERPAETRGVAIIGRGEAPSVWKGRLNG